MPSVDGLALPQDLGLPELKLPDVGASLGLPPGLTLPEGFTLPEGVAMPTFSDAAAAQQWLDVLVKTGAPPA